MDTKIGEYPTLCTPRHVNDWSQSLTESFLSVSAPWDAWWHTGDVPFGELMNQAVKLKTHQAKPDRTKWDSWPKFYQNSMFAYSKEEVIAAVPPKQPV